MQALISNVWNLPSKTTLAHVSMIILYSSYIFKCRIYSFKNINPAWLGLLGPHPSYLSFLLPPTSLKVLLRSWIPKPQSATALNRVSGKNGPFSQSRKALPDLQDDSCSLGHPRQAALDGVGLTHQMAIFQLSEISLPSSFRRKNI